MDDLISRQAAVDTPEKFIKDCNPEHFVGHSNFSEYMSTVGIRSFGNWQYANGFNMGLTTVEVAIEKLPSAQQEPSAEIQRILNYLDTTLHPIVSPDNWDVYAKLHDMVSELPSAQPETCEGCKHFGEDWENEIEYGYPSPCTRCKRRVGDNYER